MVNKTCGSKKKVILSATSDPATDQRLYKVAESLENAGFIPIVAGTKIKRTAKIPGRIYRIKEFCMLFKKGPMFYAEFNFRLFLYLLFSKVNILVANDLDSLPANYLAYRLKRILNPGLKLVYDSHELFTELPELNGRERTKKIWINIEKRILPLIKNAYTVCQPIANYYHEKYGLCMEVIRNMPKLKNSYSKLKEPSPIEFPVNKKIILYQGALNIGRGIEQVIDLLPDLEDVVFVIAGTGTIEKSLHQRVIQKKLGDKVIFTGKISLEQLNQLSPKADLGLVMQADLSLSYRYVLPNRLFDFIKARVPVIASDLPEIKNIVELEKTGLMVHGLDDPELLSKIKRLLYDEELRLQIKTALTSCSTKYCWENEEPKLINFYRNLK